MREELLNLTFAINCLICGKPIQISYQWNDTNDDIEVKNDDIIVCGMEYSELFNSTCTPLNGGFRHIYCIKD